MMSGDVTAFRIASSACLPRHPAVAYLFLVRCFATTSCAGGSNIIEEPAEASRLLFLAEFLESGIAAQKIPLRVEPEKRGRKAVIIRNLQTTPQPWNCAVFLAD